MNLIKLIIKMNEENFEDKKNVNNLMNQSQDITIIIDEEENNENPQNFQKAQNQSKKAPSLESENIKEEIKNTKPLKSEKEIKSKIIKKLGISKSSNPLICILHIIFKLLSIIIYLFFGFFLNNIPIFILVSILSVFDFWVVKNISGR